MIQAQIQKIVLTVEGLTNDGQPFALFNGSPLFLNHGFLPGERLSITFDEFDKIADIELYEPSPNRVKPDCFYHGPCGGCDLLELSEKQRKIEKRNIIKRALDKLEQEPYIHSFLSSPEIIRYLPRMRLHQGRDFQQRDAGYLASQAFQHNAPSGIVPITACAIVTAALSRRIVAARRILSQIPIIIESMILMSSSDVASDDVSGHLVLQKGKSVNQYLDEYTKIKKALQLKGLSVANSSQKIKQVMGSMAVSGLIAPTVSPTLFEAEPSFFVQGNIFQNPVLIRKVLEFCHPIKGKRIIEGFSGAGNFTIPLADKGAKIEAVESNPSAIRSGIKNVFKAKLNEQIKLINGDALKELLKLTPEPNILLLDPPRAGTPAIDKIVKLLKPKKIVYVFCDMNAMLRDSKKIIANGYKMTEVAGLDMFPRTHRIELVCKFELL